MYQELKVMKLEQIESILNHVVVGVFGYSSYFCMLLTFGKRITYIDHRLVRLNIECEAHLTVNILVFHVFKPSKSL